MTTLTSSMKHSLTHFLKKSRHYPVEKSFPVRIPFFHLHRWLLMVSCDQIQDSETPMTKRSILSSYQRNILLRDWLLSIITRQKVMNWAWIVESTRREWWLSYREFCLHWYIGPLHVFKMKVIDANDSGSFLGDDFSSFSISWMD